MLTVAVVAGMAMLLLFYIIFRYLFGFWVRQPVFHAYDVSYYFYPNKVIQPGLPEKNKFTNFKDVKTYLMDEMTEPLWASFIEFVQTNFLKNKNNEFQPKLDNVLPYFKNASKSMFSFYTEPAREAAPFPTLVSVMTSRPVNSILRGVHLPLYYVDYLCVKKSHRKKGIAEQMIQTHHYNQRRLNKHVQVSLFKREGELTGIVPLTCYDCFGYFLDKILAGAHFKVNDKYALIEIGKTNSQVLTDYMKQPATMARFEVFIYDNYSSLLETIATKNIYIYALLSRETQQVMALYGFKRSCVTIHRKELITCHFSIKSPETASELFYFCFLDCLKSINQRLSVPYKLVAVEKIADNDLLVEKVDQAFRPFVRSPTAYFLYNYVCIPVKANKCVIFL